MKDEICWMEDDVNSTPDFATPWEAIFRWGGPISKAILTMMAWRTDDFIGSPEEFLKRLSAYRGRRDELPSNPFVLAATAIAQSEAVLADVGIVVERIDDGRIRVGRRASPGEVPAFLSDRHRKPAARRGDDVIGQAIHRLRLAFYSRRVAAALIWGHGVDRQKHLRLARGKPRIMLGRRHASFACRRGDGSRP